MTNPYFTGFTPDGMFPTAPEAPTPIPDYPRDCLIYCTGCGNHYLVTVKTRDNFAVCPTDAGHRLGESTLTKWIKEKEEKK